MKVELNDRGVWWWWEEEEEEGGGEEGGSPEHRCPYCATRPEYAGAASESNNFLKLRAELEFTD